MSWYIAAQVSTVSVTLAFFNNAGFPETRFGTFMLGRDHSHLMTSLQEPPTSRQVENPRLHSNKPVVLSGRRSNVTSARGPREECLMNLSIAEDWWASHVCNRPGARQNWLPAQIGNYSAWRGGARLYWYSTWCTTCDMVSLELGDFGNPLKIQLEPISRWSGWVQRGSSARKGLSKTSDE